MSGQHWHDLGYDYSGSDWGWRHPAWSLDEVGSVLDRIDMTGDGLVIGYPAADTSAPTGER